MRNKLSFLNMLFLLLFIGRIGHLGTLAGVPWIFVITPLVLDVFFDFALEMGYINALVAKMQIALIKLKVKGIDKKLKKDL